MTTGQNPTPRTDEDKQLARVVAAMVLGGAERTDIQWVMTLYRAWKREQTR